MKVGRYPDDYAVEGFAAWRVAWEFLRRNPEYRQEWETILERYLKRDGEFRRPGEPRRSDDDDVIEYVIADQEDDTDDPGFSVPSKECERKWWLLGGYRNPDKAAPNLWFRLTFGDTWFEGQPFRERPLESLASAVGRTHSEAGNIVWVSLDLSAPIEPQCNEVAARFKAMHRAIKLRAEELGEVPTRATKRPNVHRNLLGFYLFLLDAFAEGRTPSEIADDFEADPVKSDQVLDEKKIRDRLKAAKRLTGPEGYLELLFPAGA